MPKYSYEAITETGSKILGELDAESKESANNALLARGYIPSKLRLSAMGGSNKETTNFMDRFTPIKMPELILFTKQLKTMIKAGISIIHILQVMENQTENPRLKKIIVMMSQDINEGKSLYDAFRKHEDVFSKLFCSMIKAGEASGSLTEILDRLIYIMQHEHKVKADVKSALQYPIIVMAFLGMAFIGLLKFVIPRFVKIFTSTGVELPMPTKVCIVLSNFLNTYWYFIIGGCVILIISYRMYTKTDQGQYIRDFIFINIPLFGELVLKGSMSRFSSIFSILQSSGVAVLDAMQILTGTIGNAAIAREFEKIRSKLEEGQGISGPLRSAKFFTPMVINMVAIGEESGNLDQMLNDISEHYDAEMEYATKKLSDAIGPILTVGLAVVIGFFALSIFLPMWDMSKQIH
jgi:type II secretory pathway component PulF